MIDYVEDTGIEFFNDKNWKNRLFRIIDEYNSENTYNGRFESDKEYKKRIFFELNESKNIIEKKLKKNVEFVCWPGGGVTEEALKIASEVGYISSTAGRDISNKRKSLRNIYGEDPSRINRKGITLYWNGKEDSNALIKHKNGIELILSFYLFRGKKFSKISYILLGGASG